LRSALGVSLVFTSMAGLLACPQLLSDDFGPLVSEDAESCARRQTCAAGAGGAGGSGSSSGSGGSATGGSGSTAGAGGSGPAGAAGSGGSGAGGSADAGSGGSSGSSGSGGGGTGGSAQPDASAPPPDPGPDCWVVHLEDTTHDATGNCLGINGWNQIETDPASDSVVTLSYEDDGVCFTGTIDNVGWGAVYNLTFNDTGPWDADSLGVGGFQLDAEGATLPPLIRVIYSDDDAGDFCRIITPGADVQVPFTSAHPSCSTSSSSVTDAVDLTHLRLAMPPAGSDYAIDFCLGIRAIP
jgi:hypothetical protein